MRLSSRPLEKALRAAARKEMRTEKVAWADYKRYRQGWIKRTTSAYSGIVGYWIVLWLLVLWRFFKSGVPSVVVGIALYATATTLFRGFNFRFQTLQGRDRGVFLHMPVSDDEFLQHQWIGFALSWSIVFLGLLVAHCTLVLASGSLFIPVRAALAAALLQTLCGLSVSIWILAVFPDLKTFSTFPLYLAAIACIWLPSSAIQFLWIAILLTPAGWISHVFGITVGLSPQSEVLWLVPALLLALSVPLAFLRANRRLLARLHAHDTADHLVSEPNLPEEDTDPSVPLQTSRVFSYGAAVRPSDWANAGWIERIVNRWFTERDRRVADFMLGQGLGSWSRLWRVGALISAGGIVLIALTRGLPSLVLFLPMVTATLIAAPLFGGAWPGFQRWATFGGVIPTYAVFPVGYGEISRVMFKANTVCILAWAPLLMANTVALAARLENDPAHGLLIGVEVLVFILATQPAMVIVNISPGTNDTRQMNLQKLSFFVGAMFLLIPTVTAATLIFLADTLFGKSLSVLGLLGCTTLAWRAYMWLFNRGRVDLLSRGR